MVGWSRSVPKDPKGSIEIPTMPVVEQEVSTQMDVESPKDKSDKIELPVTVSFSQETVKEQSERYPYGYTGSLPRECEIPLDVLKHIYETFGDDCEEDHDCKDAHDMAMAVQERNKNSSGEVE